MIKISHALVLIMAVWCAGLLVWTSQSVQKSEKELSKVERQKIAETENVRVLMSEWEYLNRPSRLEVLIQDYQFVENKNNTDTKILLSLSEVKEPVIPALPRVKPSRLLNHASLKKDIEVRAPAKLNTEEKFGTVISDLLKEEGQ